MATTTAIKTVADGLARALLGDSSPLPCAEPRLCEGIDCEAEAEVELHADRLCRACAWQAASEDLARWLSPRWEPTSASAGMARESIAVLQQLTKDVVARAAAKGVR